MELLNDEVQSGLIHMKLLLHPSEETQGRRANHKEASTREPGSGKEGEEFAAVTLAEICQKAHKHEVRTPARSGNGSGRTKSGTNTGKGSGGVADFSFASRDTAFPVRARALTLPGHLKSY